VQITSHLHTLRLFVDNLIRATTFFDALEAFIYKASRASIFSRSSASVKIAIFAYLSIAKTYRISHQPSQTAATCMTRAGTTKRAYRVPPVNWAITALTAVLTVNATRMGTTAL